MRRLPWPSRRTLSVMASRVRGGDAAPVGRAEREQLPLVIFMGVSVAAQTARELIDDGLAPQTPAAMVFDAGGDDEAAIRAPLESFADCEKPVIRHSGWAAAFGI